MKILRTVFFLMVTLLSFACGKTKNSNMLEGKWSVLDTMQQYQNPLSQKIEKDTVVSYSNIEFQTSGNYLINGINTGTYSIINDSIFTMEPFGFRFTIVSFGNGKLTTRRAGFSGEQKSFTDPDTPGMYWYANIDFVFTDYQKKVD